MVVTDFRMKTSACPKQTLDQHVPLSTLVRMRDVEYQMAQSHSLF